MRLEGVSDSTTVLQLKEMILSKTGVMCHRQNLLYLGRVLEDAETVESAEFRNGKALCVNFLYDPRPD